MLAAAAINALLNAASVVEVKRSFTSCRAAVAYLQRNPEIGDLRYNISYGYSRTAPAPHASHTIYRIRFAIRDPLVTVPAWNWPNASDADETMLAAFTRNVESHEAGHSRIASTFAARVPHSAVLPAKMTRAQAAHYFDAFFHSELTALRREQDTYDRLTDHGRLTQGTILMCAQG